MENKESRSISTTEIIENDESHYLLQNVLTTPTNYRFRYVRVSKSISTSEYVLPEWSSHRQAPEVSIAQVNYTISKPFWNAFKPARISIQQNLNMIKSSKLETKQNGDPSMFKLKFNFFYHPVILYIRPVSD